MKGVSLELNFGASPSGWGYGGASPADDAVHAASELDAKTRSSADTLPSVAVTIDRMASKEGFCFPCIILVIEAALSPVFRANSAALIAPEAM